MALRVPFLGHPLADVFDERLRRHGGETVRAHSQGELSMHRDLKFYASELEGGALKNKLGEHAETEAFVHHSHHGVVVVHDETRAGGYFVAREYGIEFGVVIAASYLCKARWPEIL